MKKATFHTHWGDYSGEATKSAGFDDSESVEYRHYIFFVDGKRVAYYAREDRIEWQDDAAED